MNESTGKETPTSNEATSKTRPAAKVMPEGDAPDLTGSDQSPRAKGEPKQHRSHTWVYVLVSLFIIVVVIPLLIAGWLGFVPGLSNIMGARTPRDLGVSWTAADLANYKSKTSTQFLDFANAPVNPQNPAKKTIFADPKTVSNLSLSQSEITAAINSLNWELLPANNVQVRLTPGTMEVSGNLKLERVVQFANFIGGVGYSSSDVQKAADWGLKFANGAAFYVKGKTSVSNNKLSLALEQVQIGRFKVPMDVASKVITTGGSNGINNTKYLDVKSGTVGQGVLNFTGTYPTTIYVKH